MPKPVTLTYKKKTNAYTNKNSSRNKKTKKAKEKKQEDEEKRQIVPRLFSLCPVPSLKWRFISLNPNSISAFAGIKLPNMYEAKREMFNKIFDFERLRISSSFQALQDPDKKKKFVFSNLIRTNRYAADVIIRKSSQTNPEDFAHYFDQEVPITLLRDVLNSEDLDNISLCAIDPNRNQVFVASYGGGSRRHMKKEIERMAAEDMGDTLLNISTAKTVSVQRARAEMTNILLDGGRKYNKAK
ncbi:uncharacterized protein B0P05DRAFT_568363 [Gilbertella persicaria]|uniref:uncharacterized protein n=1 Tax=Gilbertella persicaria TaxID=101096 RepID=UPI00221F76CB|nr:uncharacterized protein B0P05DRAFT_568363 [Gilbertella persicaria]KAI8092169.1 hypothetical protein B0P05DRAFT_568363 [Gilbertella persicaria]